MQSFILGILLASFPQISYVEIPIPYPEDVTSFEIYLIQLSWVHANIGRPLNMSAIKIMILYWVINEILSLS